MVEFVSNYRRSDKINGKLSYSNLYTSISVLAGHYASYGPKFPVPEKRRKRLLQVRYTFCSPPLYLKKYHPSRACTVVYSSRARAAVFFFLRGSRQTMV